jgi:uncharacterized protein (TIGR01244 family)
MARPAPDLIPLEDGLSAAGRLGRPEIEALAREGVKTIINNRPDGEEWRQLPAVEARRLAESLGLSYHHIPVTAASLSRADVDAFAAVLREAPGPIVAHCRSGTRSTLLWALVRMRAGEDPFALIARAAAHGIDIASLPAVAARLR